MKYLIGQSVRIIKKIDVGTGALWTSEMAFTIGMVGEIVDSKRIGREIFYKVELEYTPSYSIEPITDWWWYHGDALAVQPAIEANSLKYEYLIVFKEKFENSARVSHSYYSTVEEFVTFWGDELEWVELVQSSKRIKE